MSPLEQLLTVQAQDTTADQLRHRRSHLPERAERARRIEALSAIEASGSAARQQREELARTQRRLEDEIASLGDKADHVDRTLYSGTVNVPRELQALQEELTGIRRRQRVLEDDVLEVMERAEPVDAELARLDGDRAGHEAAVANLSATIAEAEAMIDEELRGVEHDRAEAAAAVPADLLTEYERLRSRLGGVGVARLTGTSCGGCHLTLSAVELDRIRRKPTDAAVHCEECGRILVR